MPAANSGPATAPTNPRRPGTWSRRSATPIIVQAPASSRPARPGAGSGSRSPPRTRSPASSRGRPRGVRRRGRPRGPPSARPPISAPRVEPSPPSTSAMNALIVGSRSARGVIAPTFANHSRPTIPAIAPLMAKAIISTRSGLTPISRVTSGSSAADAQLRAERGPVEERVEDRHDHRRGGDRDQLRATGTRMPPISTTSLNSGRQHQDRAGSRRSRGSPRTGSRAARRTR